MSVVYSKHEKLLRGEFIRSCECSGYFRLPNIFELKPWGWVSTTPSMLILDSVLGFSKASGHSRLPMLRNSLSSYLGFSDNKPRLRWHTPSFSTVPTRKPCSVKFFFIPLPCLKTPGPNISRESWIRQHQWSFLAESPCKNDPTLFTSHDQFWNSGHI